MFKNKNNKTLYFHCAAYKVMLRVFKKAELSPDTPLAWKNKSRIFLALYHFHLGRKPRRVPTLAPTWIPRTRFILRALVLSAGYFSVFYYFDFLVVGTVPLPDISTVF